MSQQEQDNYDGSIRVPFLLGNAHFEPPYDDLDKAAAKDVIDFLDSSNGCAGEFLRRVGKSEEEVVKLIARARGNALAVIEN